MKIQILEAMTSTPKRPLWIWRVWRDGRLTQGFSTSRKDAQLQAEFAQLPSRDRWQ
jgi:hypothetical protein